MVFVWNLFIAQLATLKQVYATFALIEQNRIKAFLGF
jgi:hypothetical protein